MKPNWQVNFKTKEEAEQSILEGLVMNTNCAGEDGLINIVYKGEYLALKPIKKKKEDKQDAKV